MYKGDKHGDARFLCGRDHRDAFPLSGGLLIVDSYLKWSAANRRAGELLRSVLTREQYLQLTRRGYVDIPSLRDQERIYRVPQASGFVG
jgi:hypothetical protein